MKTFHRNSILLMLLFFSILFTILAFLPFLGRPGFETRDALTPNRIIEISFLLLSASLLTGSVIAFRVGLRFDRTPVYLAGSFSLWALLSTIWSDSPLYTFGKSVELVVLLYNTTLISSISLHCMNYRVAPLRTTLPYAMLIAGLFAIVATAIVSGNSFIFSETSVRTGRLSIGTSHPLETADFLSLAIICIVTSSITFRIKTIYTTILIILLSLTGGRAPIVIFLFAISLVFYKQLRTTRSRQTFFVFVLFSVTMSAIFFLFPGEGYYYLLPDDLNSLNNRIPNWLFALDIATENALVGVGYFASRESLIHFFTLEGNTLRAWGGLVHNSYIEIFLTTGIIGLGILLLFVIYGFRKIFRGGNALIVGVFTYIISRSILDAILFSPDLSMFILMVVLTAGPAFEAQTRQFGAARESAQHLLRS